MVVCLMINLEVESLGDDVTDDLFVDKDFMSEETCGDKLGL